MGVSGVNTATELNYFTTSNTEATRRASNPGDDTVGLNIPINQPKLSDLIGRITQSNEKEIQEVNGHNTTVEFSVHKATNTITFKVLDRDTGEVLREIPPEKILDLLAKMMEMAGIIVDKRI